MFENVSTAERQQVLGALERLQATLAQREEWTHSDTVGSLRQTLQSPLFTHILTLQQSIRQLRNQLSLMPPGSCSEFSFSKKGQLIMSAASPSNGAALHAASVSTPSLTSSSPSSTHHSPPADDHLQKWILDAAKGRHTELVRLTRPLSGGLGFSVVGLSPTGNGSSQGVFVRHVQPGGVAHRDGGLQERDHILVINGVPLEAGISQQQALALLQQPGEQVELVVAREHLKASPPAANANATVRADEWGHVEEIKLVNDGAGLGFGIVGGKPSGVVVRTLVPDSVAHRDGRLRTGDHILRIGATPTSGLTSDQVVKVLQQCGSHVTMLIARDPQGSSLSAPPPPPPPNSAPVSSLPPRLPPQPPLPPLPPQRRPSRVAATPNLEGFEIHEVSLMKKHGQSLGISIIGHNPLTSQDAVGVFVKHVVSGSAADQSGNVRVHDRLIALDGVSLHGLTNQEVVQVMKRTGQTVVLTLVRKKTRAPERSLDKVERESSRVSLKRSLEVKACSSGFGLTSLEKASSDKTQLTKGSSACEATGEELRAKWEAALGPNYRVLVVSLDPVIEDDAELQKYSKLLPIHTLRLGVELDSFDGHHYVSSVAPGGPVDKHGVLRPEDELLEVNGVQVYGKSRREVVSFLKEAPPPFTLVCCRRLTSDLGPESETDSEPEPALKTEPGPVRAAPHPSVEEIELKLSSMLCSPAEPREPPAEPQPAHGQELVSPPTEVLSEASQEEEEEEEEEEETSDEGDEDGELALWSPDVHVLELQKETDRGLGFSILDYQDPLDAGRCVMVIRSLVSGGSAEHHGGLLPGDQLVSVNQVQMDQLSLSETVNLLKAVPAGTVRLGIRKPLVDGAEKSREDAKIPTPGAKDDEEPELILDGGRPRYTSSKALPLVGDTEMAVDEEEEEEEEEESVAEISSSLHHKSPVSWEGWTVSSMKAEERGRREEEERGRREEEERGRREEEEELHRSDRESVVSAGNIFDGILDSRDSEADSELTLTDTDTESVRMIDREKRKRRSQGGSSLPTRRGHSDLPEREDGEGEETPTFSHWGPARRVEVWPEEGQSLGLSIVGGRHVIKRLKNGEELKGIFIKQVLPNSPAAKTHCLKTGDKILEVSGVDLQAASHEEAVNAIKSAESPVVFIVQSLSTTPRPLSLTATSYNKHKSTKTAQPAVAPPPLRQPPPYRPPSQSQQELNSDLEKAKGRWRERYGDLQGALLCVELEKEQQGLGLSLAGNSDRSRLSIFVVGLHPGGPAARDGRIQVGDELLEINNQVLYGRSHQNASAIIKSTAAATVKLLLLRNEDALTQMAVLPLSTPPTFSPVSSEPPTDGSTDGSQMMIRPSSDSLRRDQTDPGSVEQDVTCEDGGQVNRTDNSAPRCPSKAETFQKKLKSAERPQNEALRDTLEQQHAAASPPLVSPEPQDNSADPSTCAVLPGQETLLEISKGRSGLGLSIVGGRDTQLDAIVIHEVYEEGAAARDGRLWPGDQILEVNGVNLRGASHQEAIAALRQTPARVRLVVLRDESQYRDEENLDLFQVELQKKSGRGLGLSIVGKRTGSGVFISEVVRGGAAELDGRLMQGDQILSVNGEDTRHVSQEAVAAILKCARGPVLLELGRLKAASWVSSGGSHVSSLFRADSRLTPPSSERGLLQASPAVAPTSDPPTTDGGSSDITSCSGAAGGVRTVELTRGATDSLGVSVAGGKGSPLGDIPVFIAMIQANGVAAKTHRLKVGDRIVSINGRCVDGWSHSDAVAMLKNSYGTISLQVVADTNISAIASQAESLSSSSCVLTKADTHTADPEAPFSRSITLLKGSEGLGFSVVGGFGSPHGDLPVYVKSVFSTGAAAADGRLKRGDQVLAVNGESLQGATHEQAVAILKKQRGTVTLDVLS
ncbi:inaD-like protein isoform X2 [Takifugu rubripes]|uniref:inaD-like protein isoform X2 n=1 Tax=Takifugu rubripes TaxID=31033 RepID=UPI00114534F5|nr:inaD-like protein isoform X2 [Takifugu rubripes]